jgi:hypothetical protein
MVEIPAEHDEVGKNQPAECDYRQLQRKAQCLSEMDPQRLRFGGELHNRCIGIYAPQIREVIRRGRCCLNLRLKARLGQESF